MKPASSRFGLIYNRCCNICSCNGHTQRLLALAILGIAQLKFILLTVACIYCNEGMLDCAPILLVLVDFGGLNAPRSDKKKSLIREVVNVIEEVAESASN